MGIGVRARKIRIAFAIRTVLLVGNFLVYLVISRNKSTFPGSKTHLNGDAGLQLHDQSIAIRHLLTLEDTLGRNCTPPALDEFPPDGFSRQDRQHGWAFLHLAVACYCFVLLANICHEYFVPAIRVICDKLPLSEDVVGATIMAAASSSPELFINCVGTFITKSDLGVGAVVGSAVFNVLAVPAVSGLLAKQVVELDWWPVSRDCLMYTFAVILLIVVLNDGRVEWSEALILVLAYLIYIFAMYFNSKISRNVKGLVKRCKHRSPFTDISEIKPLLTYSDQKKLGEGADTIITMPVCKTHYPKAIKVKATVNQYESIDESDEEPSQSVFEWPDSSVTWLVKLYWLLTWPISFCLYITIPDCRKHPKLLGLTFTMCIVWIATISYLVAWMITTIGDTLNIPDSVMGLTILAAGTSVPEAISSIIVTNQGFGGMGISNSIGSNTFDILLCLGLPWLIKGLFYPVPGEEDGRYVQINSIGLSYSAIVLLSSLFYLYGSFVLNKFRLDWKVGVSCLIMYAAFLTFASLIELNVFFEVNLPICHRK